MSEFDFGDDAPGPVEWAEKFFKDNLPEQWVDEVPHPLFIARLAVAGELDRIQQEVDNPYDPRPETADMRVALAFDEEAARAAPFFPRPYGEQPRPRAFIDPITGRYSYDGSRRFSPQNPNDPINNSLL